MHEYQKHTSWHIPEKLGWKKKAFSKKQLIYAIKSVIAWQLGEEMKKKKITKKRMTEIMQISHAQLNHVLDPQSKNTHLETLQSAAKIVGRELRVELI